MLQWLNSGIKTILETYFTTVTIHTVYLTKHLLYLIFLQRSFDARTTMDLLVGMLSQIAVL